jgi:hypothetical protein
VDLKCGGVFFGFGGIEGLAVKQDFRLVIEPAVLITDLLVMDWPLRLMSQGMIMGFLGEPKSPMVEARGMPISIWVAWISPFESALRIAAQLAPLRIVELMPYFIEETLLVGDDDRGTVRKRNDAEFEIRRFRPSSSIDPTDPIRGKAGQNRRCAKAFGSRG